MMCGIKNNVWDSDPPKVPRIGNDSQSTNSRGPHSRGTTPIYTSDKDSYMSLCLLQLPPAFQTIKIHFKLYIRYSHNIWLKGVWTLYPLLSLYDQVGILTFLIRGGSGTSVLQNNTNSAHGVVLKSASGSFLSSFSALRTTVNNTLVSSMLT